MHMQQGSMCRECFQPKSPSHVGVTTRPHLAQVQSASH